MQASTARATEATFLAPSLAATVLVVATAVLEERIALSSVAVTVEATVAVDDDVDTDSLRDFVAEEADSVVVPPAVLLDTTSPPGTEAMGWRSSLASQLCAVSQPVLYSCSHQNDCVTR